MDRGDRGGAKVVRQIGIIVLQLVQNPAVHQVVDGAATQTVIALGCDDLEVTVRLRFQHRDIQGAAAEVEHRHVGARAHGLLGGVVDGGRPWLGKETQTLFGNARCNGASLQLVHGVSGPGLGVRQSNGLGILVSVLRLTGAQNRGQHRAHDLRQRQILGSQLHFIVVDVALGAEQQARGVAASASQCGIAVE